MGTRGIYGIRYKNELKLNYMWKDGHLDNMACIVGELAYYFTFDELIKLYNSIEMVSWHDLRPVPNFSGSRFYPIPLQKTGIAYKFYGKLMFLDPTSFGGKSKKMRGSPFTVDGGVGILNMDDWLIELFNTDFNSDPIKLVEFTSIKINEIVPPLRKTIEEKMEEEFNHNFHYKEPRTIDLIENKIKQRKISIISYT
jgi:hypothetical protein